MRSVREDHDGNVEENALEWETTQEAVALVQARENTSELGQGRENGEDEMNLGAPQRRVTRTWHLIRQRTLRGHT